MRYSIPFKYFLSVIFLFQLLSCNSNSGEITYSNQTTDSTATLTADSDVVLTDTSNAKALNEELDFIEDREEGPDDFIMNGDYYASDPSLKLIIDPPTFEYYVGPQLKMKGKVSMTDFNNNAKMVFTPFGKDKKEMILPSKWADDYTAIWVVIEGDTFYRQIRVLP